MAYFSICSTESVCDPGTVCRRIYNPGNGGSVCGNLLFLTSPINPPIRTKTAVWLIRYLQLHIKLLLRNCDSDQQDLAQSPKVMIASTEAKCSTVNGRLHNTYNKVKRRGIFPDVGKGGVDLPLYQILPSFWRQLTG